MVRKAENMGWIPEELATASLGLGEDSLTIDVYLTSRTSLATGAFVLGEMGRHTSNAGRIYFPSGTPDLDDISAGAVDMPGSVAREVEEETGLTAADYTAATQWDCVASGAAIALIRILHVDMPGEALRARIEANLARQHQPELSAIHLVRGVSDLTAAMPRFVTAFIEAQSASP